MRREACVLFASEELDISGKLLPSTPPPFFSSDGFGLTRGVVVLHSTLSFAVFSSCLHTFPS